MHIFALYCYLYILYTTAPTYFSYASSPISLALNACAMRNTNTYFFQFLEFFPRVWDLIYFTPLLTPVPCSEHIFDRVGGTPPP